MEEKLIFGWVSPQVQCNWANWSTWKQYGNQEDANEFYKLTQDDAYEQGLTWFEMLDEEES